MLFTKTLKRELRSISGMVFAGLFTIMVTTSLVRFLGRAATGRVDSASVLPLIAFSSINILGPLLVMTLFAAVLMTLTRSWRDHEMVVWQASGLSLVAWIRPVIAFSAPIVMTAALVSLYLAPWANQQIADYQRRFDQRGDISMVSAGQFRESSGANRVFFVESLNDDHTEVRNVFVTQRKGDRLTVVVSKGGKIENREDGSRYLVLEKGRRYDGNVSDAELRLMEFERYGLRIEQKPVTQTKTRSKAKPTSELLGSSSADDQGELVRRIGIPISAILLAILAIPLSSSNPRVGRSFNLLVALMLFMIYFNLQSLMQAWVAKERIAFALGVWVVHGGALLVIVVMFWRRMSLSRLIAPWSSRRRPAKAVA